MKIFNPKRIHFTGIKGVGMTALAIYYKQKGIKVTGSDIKEYFVTDEALKKAKINWRIGFAKNNIDPKQDLLITTGAHGGLKNPEVIAAAKMGIRVLTYAEALAEVVREKELIAVCGVGGKGTTASIIATLLNYSNLHPSYVIGMGEIYPIGASGRYDPRGKHFICEADEYAISPGINNNPKFSLLKPKILVVTNIEHDHPDIYPSLSGTLKTYRKFFERVPKDGLLIACVDNINVRKAIKGLKVPIETYGFSKDADWLISNLVFKKQKTSLKIVNKDDTDLTLFVPGKYNVRNATAAYIVGKHLGITNKKLKGGLAKYRGCRRRFEYMGKYMDARFYDDYAHHPEEIKSVLSATRNWFKDQRIIAIFQPHTYSRTKALFKQFADAFGKADLVCFMDIYASAREKKDKSVSSEKLSVECKKSHNNVYYTQDHKKTLEWIKKEVKNNDVVLTMGAGNIFHLYKDLK